MEIYLLWFCVFFKVVYLFHNFCNCIFFLCFYFALKKNWLKILNYISCNQVLKKSASIFIVRLRYFCMYISGWMLILMSYSNISICRQLYVILGMFFSGYKIVQPWILIYLVMGLICGKILVGKLIWIK